MWQLMNDIIKCLYLFNLIKAPTAKHPNILNRIMSFFGSGHFSVILHKMNLFNAKYESEKIKKIRQQEEKDELAKGIRHLK